MKILVAIGGNALTESDNPRGQIDQEKIDAVASRLVELEEAYTLIVTHGNGPQVGWLAMQEVEANMSMDLLDAQSEGLLGYRLAQAMDNCRQTERSVSLLTRVEVDPADQAFSRPSKPIGSVLENARAERLAHQQGWQFIDVAGGKRRVVPSPQPIRIVEEAAIATLMEQGYSVICAGGGGIPVVREEKRWHGVGAVIDKDYTSALLASKLQVDGLLLLTNVDALYHNWGETTAQAVRKAGCQNLNSAGLAQGSMAPKVEAACRFVNNTKGFAAIGMLNSMHALLEGRQGTQIVSGDAPIEWW